MVWQIFLNISKERIRLHKLIDIKKHIDQRGTLTKLFTKSSLENDSIPSLEESYVITFNDKGIVRGQHYHKFTKEIFAVLQGRCRFDLYEDNKIISIDIDAKGNQSIYVGKETPHQITSLIENSIVVALSTREYDMHDNDTFYFNFKDL